MFPQDLNAGKFTAFWNGWQCRLIDIGQTCSRVSTATHFYMYFIHPGFSVGKSNHIQTIHSSTLKWKQVNYRIGVLYRLFLSISCQQWNKFLSLEKTICIVWDKVPTKKW